MSMQLFNFGHPCEHQLRRTCIGGSSCPLNGYPDAWCCSYIKGKINFKRDKPCEGPRCRWGFHHPTSAQFDAVTQVLQESRPIAAKIDEAEENEILTFELENPHLVDTVQCALHMMRHPASACATRVGQLLAFAAVKAGEAKVFMQLLKTMKKPVDGYVLGAYAFLKSPAATAAATTAATSAAPAAASSTKPHKKNTGAQAAAAQAKREDVVTELRNDMVDLMNAALSQGGHLVDRDDQHMLQATFILALRQYPRSNKRRHEMLEAAIQKYGSDPMAKEAAAAPKPTAPPPPAAATPTTAAGGISPSSAVRSANAPASLPAPSEAVAAAPAAAAPASEAAAVTPITMAAAVAAKGRRAPPNVSAADLSPPPVMPKSSSETAATTPAQVPAAAAPAVVGISSVVAARPPVPRTATTYTPLRPDAELPAVLIFGGQFALTAACAATAPRGAASTRLPALDPRAPQMNALPRTPSSDAPADYHEALLGSTAADGGFDHLDSDHLVAEFVD